MDENDEQGFICTGNFLTPRLDPATWVVNDLDRQRLGSRDKGRCVLCTPQKGS